VTGRASKITISRPRDPDPIPSGFIYEAGASGDTTRVDLVLDFGDSPYRDAVCPLCGGVVDWDATFGLAVKGGARVCGTCAAGCTPEGYRAASEDFLAALESLDTALHYAPAGLRPGLLGNAAKVLAWLADRYAADETAQP
jgi:hypothetical protein